MLSRNISEICNVLLQYTVAVKIVHSHCRINEPQLDNSFIHGYNLEVMLYCVCVLPNIWL